MGRLESHRIVAHMTSSDDIIFSNLSDGLLDGEGNYRNCEEPLHSGLFVLASCLLWVVLLAPPMLLGLRHMLGFLGDKHWGTQLFMVCARWRLKQQLPVPALKKVRKGENLE